LSTSLKQYKALAIKHQTIMTLKNLVGKG